MPDELKGIHIIDFSYVFNFPVCVCLLFIAFVCFVLGLLVHIREFQQEFTKHLSNIYQPFTKNLPKIRPYLAFYLLKSYQGFTKDLLSLPNTYQKLTKIFFQFTKHLPKMFGQKYFDTFICIFSKIFSYSQLALQVLMKTGDFIVAKYF